MRGFRAGCFEKKGRLWMKDEDWEEIYKFSYEPMMNPYEKYCFRTGAWH
jgi:hypothetical protein